jgi:PIN domain nuclease of toxin-antitoxin system
MGGMTDSYLLDTHAVLWVLTEPTRLSDRVRPVLKKRSSDLYVSSASAWEIATKHRRGELPQADAVIGGYERHLRRAEIETIPISSEHALLAGGSSGSTETRSIGSSALPRWSRDSRGSRTMGPF